MELTPETILHNRYRIIRQLGQGGMGAVYLAYDTSLEQQVAVKANRNISAQSTTQFLREAMLLANLRHPNLPRVMDYFILEQDQFLVMDFIQGDDLEKLINEKGPQPVEQVLRWSDQLISALSYLHRQNPPVIHRDIKPANIKLTPQGEVILVDFGIAKATEITQQTATGAYGFTPGFAPPEQYGTGHTGPFSDQYALAATLYNLLTGLHPADSVERVLGKSVLTPIHQVVPQIPAYVEAAIERAMAIRPDDRYPNVDEFLSALTNPSAELTMRSGKTSVYPQTSAAGAKSSLPKWVIGAAAAGLLIVILAIGTVGGYFLLRNNKHTTPTLTQVALVQATPATTAIPATLPVLATIALTTQPVQETSTPQPTETLAASPTTVQAAAPPLGKGGLIAFSSNRADGKTFQIWVVGVSLANDGTITVDKASLKQLTDSAGDKHEPVWSPDGTKLIYTAPGGKDKNGKDLGLDLWLANSDGSSPLDLTNIPGNETHPAWSPDGKLIAFDSDNRSDGINQIYLVNSDGKNIRRVSYDMQELSPTWSPDGAWLAFVGTANNNRILYLRKQVDQYPLPYPTPNPTPKPFDRRSFTGNLGQVADPAWSPDGTTMAYTRVEGLLKNINVAGFALFKFDLIDISKVTPITTTNTDYNPVWSPDSLWIAFTSEREGNPQIYVMSNTGLLQTNVSQSQGIDTEPSWQPLVKP